MCTGFQYLCNLPETLQMKVIKISNFPTKEIVAVVLNFGIEFVLVSFVWSLQVLLSFVLSFWSFAIVKISYKV